MRPARSAAFVRELARSFSAHDSLDLSAQLAFNALLALFPFAILLATLLGLVPVAGLEDEIERTILAFAPEQAKPILVAALHNAVRGASPLLFALGVAGALWFARGGVASLMVALNRAHGVRETRSWAVRQLVALAVTLGGAVLTIVASAALLLGPDFARHASDWFGLGRAFDLAWRVARWPATVAAMVVLTAFVHWACPSVRRRFRLFSPGAVTSVLVWIVVTLAFDLYVRRFGTFNKMYGTLAAGVVLLLWIQLSGLALIVGAEVDALLEKRRARAIPV